MNKTILVSLCFVFSPLIFAHPKNPAVLNQTGFEKGATFGLFSSHKANVKHAFSNKISITPASAKITEEPEQKLFGREVPYAILSVKGRPVCVADINKYSSLVPSFWRDHLTPDEVARENHPIRSLRHSHPKHKMARGNPLTFKEMVSADLPKCGMEDMNRIYQIVQNAVLVDEQNPGVKVAGGGIHFATCLGGLALGLAAGVFDDKDPSDSTTALWAVGGLGLGALIGRFQAGDFALRKELLKNMIKSGSLIGVCGLGAYFITVALLK